MPGDKISLSELNANIQGAISSAFETPVWVVAEVLEMQVNRSGHCYLELVEKSEHDNKILARSRATIWASRYTMIRSYFETTTKTPLKQGLKLLVKSTVSFHAVYGLSLNITDIDPNYTLGDMALRKQEVLQKLTDSGVISMNRELEFPEVPQRIAVISSETAAGLGDFIDSLVNNMNGYSFTVHIYPAVVQGDAAEESIISALDKIHESSATYDTVALLRGGGSQADLDCFNSYDLALNIAQFPIPVLTGIGHERDETIADIVANQSLKTPTAVAEFLLDKVQSFTNRLKRLEERFTHLSNWIVQQERMSLQQKGGDLHYLVKKVLDDEQHQLEQKEGNFRNSLQAILRESQSYLASKSQRLVYLWKGLFQLQKQQLNSLEYNGKRRILNSLQNEIEFIHNKERTLDYLKPERVLKRGYSITYHKGKVLKSISDVKPEDDVSVKIADGTLDTKIIQIKKS